MQSLAERQPWRSQQQPQCSGPVPHRVSKEEGRHAKRLTRLLYTRTLKCPQCVFNMLRCGFTLYEGLHGTSCNIKKADLLNRLWSASVLNCIASAIGKHTGSSLPLELQEGRKRYCFLMVTGAISSRSVP